MSEETLTEINAQQEQLIAAYLKDTPEFFSRHPQLVAELQIPDDTGAAVSLIAHKVKLLEKQALSYHAKLAELIHASQENELVNQRMHQLTLELLKSNTLADALKVLREHLLNEFNADAVELKLFEKEKLGEQVKASKHQGFQQFIDADAPTCGSLDKSQMDSLFGENNIQNGSAALIPLQTNKISGVMAIAANDPHRFHADKGVDFLCRLGELVSLTLQNFDSDGTN